MTSHGVKHVPEPCGDRLYARLARTHQGKDTERVVNIPRSLWTYDLGEHIMDALQFFLLRHEALRSTTAQQSIDILFSQLSEAQLRHRPRPDLNSIAWIVWHMARCEDFGVQRLVGYRPQIFDQQGWMARLHVPLRDSGTCMTE